MALTVSCEVPVTGAEGNAFCGSAVIEVQGNGEIYMIGNFVICADIKAID